MFEKLKKLLDKILKNGIKTKKGEVIYYCPFCHHHKRKFSINLDRNNSKFQYWHCWVCQKKGQTLFSLLSQLNADSFYLTELKEIYRDEKYVYTPHISDNQKPKTQLSLPKEYKPLYIKQTTPEYKAAITFLKKRNINKSDILKYSIGYCEYGPYKNRIILPSYNNLGELNYFTARDFYGYSNRKYLNPSYDREQNIINELFINWSFPVVLCEGIFDAIAIGINAIPLMGKSITSLLRMKLLHYGQPTYIALDEDAYMDAVESANDLIDQGLEIYIVKIPKGEDPGSLGFKKMQQLINSAYKYDKSEIMKELINLKI